MQQWRSPAFKLQVISAQTHTIKVELMTINQILGWADKLDAALWFFFKAVRKPDSIDRTSSASVTRLKQYLSERLYAETQHRFCAEVKSTFFALVTVQTTASSRSV